ncbi:hypothetical protein L2E82_10686 [Cichorium intybus]|uniref:Uncharacterized protein n=1 Tax=Cichorium intybus TaxID=13427 RepID=A0ACB9GB36_CICIN|nr:hypothetical protein L2E82_10686 [Cichorium intybus]
MLPEMEFCASIISLRDIAPPILRGMLPFNWYHRQCIVENTKNLKVLSIGVSVTSGSNQNRWVDKSMLESINRLEVDLQDEAIWRIWNRRKRKMNVMFGNWDPKFSISRLEPEAWSAGPQLPFSIGL